MRDNTIVCSENDCSWEDHLAPFVRRHWLFLLFFAAALLIYGYEIFNFSLSIDEEFHIGKAVELSWVAQGRPVMALIEALFPPMGATPFIPTLIFCAGVAFFSATVAERLEATVKQKILFGVFLLTSPYFMHIAEFNTTSYGIGIGLIIAAVGLKKFLDERWLVAAAYGAVTVALSLGIYQALMMAFFNAVIICLFTQLMSGKKVQLSERIGSVALALVVGFVLYALSTKAALLISEIQLQYVNSFVHVSEIFSNSEDRKSRLIMRLIESLGGGSTYYRFGIQFAILPLIGLVSLFIAGVRFGANRTMWFLTIAVLLGSLTSFQIISNAGMPPRALFGNSVIIAFFAAQSLRVTMLRRAFPALALFFLFLGVWLSVWLFGLDRAARVRDYSTGSGIIQAMNSIGVRPENPTKLILIGKLSSEYVGRRHSVDVFGTSFFEHDEGDVARVAKYLNSIGPIQLQPASLNDLENSHDEIARMSCWPKAGFTKIVSGIAILKLGPITSFQSRGATTDLSDLAACPP